MWSFSTTKNNVYKRQVWNTWCWWYQRIASKYSLLCSLKSLFIAQTIFNNFIEDDEIGKNLTSRPFALSGHTKASLNKNSGSSLTHHIEYINSNLFRFNCRPQISDVNRFQIRCVPIGEWSYSLNVK